MHKHSAFIITVSIASALMLTGCTSNPDTDKAPTPTDSVQSTASAPASPRPTARPTPRATPSVTPTGHPVPIKSLIPKVKTSNTPIPKASQIAKGSAVNLAAIAVAHWKKDTVVQPDTNTWRQSGDTGSMRGTVISGSGTGDRYTFQLSKQGAQWRIDNATRA